jgi:group I intron endonuclease
LSSLICKALLKYGHSAFTLEILEYCEPSETIAKEQYFIDLLKPQYNILLIAGSSYGHRRTDETKLKISQFRTGSVTSQETKNKIAEAILGRIHSAETLAKMKNRVLSDSHLVKLRSHLAKLNSTNGTKVKVIDTITNEISIWKSTHEAAKSLEASQSTI